MSARLVQDLQIERTRITAERNKLTQEIEAIDLLLARMTPQAAPHPVTGTELIEHLKKRKPVATNGHNNASYRRPQGFWMLWFDGAKKEFGKDARMKDVYAHALKTITPPPTFSAFKGGYERFRKQALF
jgi:hypothetical protein